MNNWNTVRVLSPEEEVEWEARLPIAGMSVDQAHGAMEVVARLIDIAELKPRWDAESRELWVGPYLVKRIKHYKISNQELVLVTFQELDWMRRVDDPLPPSDIPQKRRLAETITALNSNHITREAIRFRGDGTGKGIKWEIL